MPFQLLLLKRQHPHGLLFPVDFPHIKNTFADKFFKMINANDIDALCKGLIEFVNGAWTVKARELTEACSWVQEHNDESISIQNLLSLYHGL